MTFDNAPLIADIDACLPQTQCTRCGYPRCYDYAAAIAGGAAGINQCPPGGDVTIRTLAALLDVPGKPLDPAFGEHHRRTTAVIDERLCIGCTLCIQACPVDAILGTGKLMHTVITQECTGCALCVPPCPMDCIALVPCPPPAKTGDWPWPEYSRKQVNRARHRTEARLKRLAETQAAHNRPGGPAAAEHAMHPARTPDKQQIRKYIRDAVARVQAKRRNRPRTDC